MDTPVITQKYKRNDIINYINNYKYNYIKKIYISQCILKLLVDKILLIIT